MGLARAAVIAACLLLFLATDAFGSKCSVGCRGLHGGKAYQEGHTYVYDLEGTSVTSVPDAQNEATLKLKGTVELSVKPDCIRQIRLKGVQINGAPISLPDVEQYALQFNYHDGHIDTEVCTEASDSQSSLNIKRAVASLFQTAVFQDSGSTSYHEVDVFGSCPTDFTYHKEGDSLVVRKERNLGRCSHRENIRQGPVSAIYDFSSDIQASPLLSSHQNIEQRFKRGILNKASSVETYKLKPFSNGNIGAKTVVHTTLTLKNEKGDNPNAAVNQPKSLIFDAPHPVLKSSADRIAKALKAASTEESGTIQEHAAEKFAELVRVLRLSNKNDILAVYQKVRNGAATFDKVHDKKILLDALFRTTTGEAAEVVVDLVKGRELSGVQALVFYASLALVDHVHLPSVTAVTSLLDQPDLPRLGYLGVGQVIGKYCQEHPCENVAEVKQAVHKIREKVGNGKAKTREQENLIVSAMKALGNTKFLDDATLVKLANIAEDKSVRNRVRVAAIEALPTRCTMKWKNILLKVMADCDEDSEIRIKSYLSMVACPCQHFASALKNMLDKEEVNQVGSFIQSHLRNLRASADPGKAAAKHHLGQIKPRTKFPEDFRKFSFNDELSYHLGGVGAGSVVESNVIYSQDSFVPRSTNLNLTVELFGRSFNFLELNTRMENLDRMIEHYFGPKGVLEQDDDDVEEVVEKGLHDAKEIGGYIEEKMNKLRSKREVKQGELDKFAKGVKLRNNEVDQHLNLDLSVKMFGVEMYYLTHSGQTEDLTPKQVIDNIFKNIEMGIDKLKKFDYKLNSHMQFLDSELVYPTNLGAPLTLSVLGTSSMLFKIYGKIDVQAIMANPDKAELYFGFDPSAAVRVAGTLAVKAFDVESGMKVVGTLHTDTATDFKVKMLDGKGIDFSIGTPMHKEKIIFLNSEILMSSGQKDNVYEAAKFSKGKIYDDCFDQVSSLMGASFCGHVEFPYDNVETMQKRALFPLNGPSKFSATLNNLDYRYYRLKIFYDNTSPKSRSFEVLIETPNSKTERRLSLTAEAGVEPNKYARMTLDSPFKKVSAEAVLKDTPEEHSLTIKVHNDNQEYYGRAGLLANGAKYKPVLEYKVPEHVEKLSGVKSSHHGGQQYNVDGVVELVDQDGGKKYVFDQVALIAEGRKVVGINGYIMSAKNVAALDMSLSYGEESVALKMNGKKLGERHFLLGLSAVPSRDPNIGFDLEWEYRKDEHEYDNKLVFVHGPDLKSDVNRFTFKQHWISKMNQGENSIIGGSSKISYPALKMIFDVEGKLMANTIEGDIDIVYDKFKFGTELSVKKDMVKHGDYEVEFEAELLQNSVKLESKRTVIDPHKSKYKNSIELSPGGKYETEAVIKYQSDKNKVDFELDGHMNLNGKKVKTVGALKVDPANVNSHAVISVDDVKYVNFLLKLRKGDSPYGNLILNLKNYLNVDGEVKRQGDKGNLHLNIELPKFNRKIKGTGDLVVAGTVHTAHLELLLDAEKDPSKFIKWSTVTDYKENAVDTKNVLQVLDSKIELNGKYTLENTMDNGKLNVELDFTAPDGSNVVYKVKRVSKKEDDMLDIHAEATLDYHKSKGGESMKIGYVGDLQAKKHTVRSKTKIHVTEFSGKTREYESQINNLPGVDGHKKWFEISVKSNSEPNPWIVDYKIKELENGEFSDHLITSFGKFQFKGAGSYSPGNNKDKPYAISTNVEMVLPSEKLRNLKLDLKGSLLKQPENHYIKSEWSSDLTYNDDKTIKFDGFINNNGIYDIEHAHDGEMKITLTLYNKPPMMVYDKFTYEPLGEKMKATRNLIYNVDGKETTIIIDSLICNRDFSSIHLSGKATTPYEKMHNVDFSLNHERSKDGRTRTTETAVTVDKTKYTAKSEIQEGNISPKIHIIFTCPNGKTELLSKFEKLGEHEYTGEWKIDTPKGFAVADTHVKLDSIDNFIIGVNFDSDKIKHRKIHAEITNNPTAKTGKKIVITVTSEGKNIVTGSTSYKRRDEAGKTIVEGNGNLKIGEDTRSSSFKYTRQQLTREKDGEVGVVIVLNAKFDPVAIVGDLKLSNKEFLVSNSYCEQNKDCAHFKLQSSYDTDNKDYLKHQLTVEVDLKKFQLPVEFGLKTSTEMKEDSFDHSANLYLHSSKDKSEYTYHLYAHPKESGAVLTLPTRELALIATSDLPKTKHSGSFKFDIALYLDRKNKPSEKTGVSINGDANIDKNSLSANGEMKLVYPSQPKDMTVKGRLHYGGEHLLDANMDIDMFSKKTQKITVVAKVNKQSIDSSGYNITSLLEMNSRGQHLKIDLKSHVALTKNAVGFGSFLSYLDRHQKPKNVGVLFSADDSEIHLLATAPNKEIIRADAKLQVHKNLQKLDAEIVVVGNKPIVANFEAKDWSTFTYLEYQKDNPNTKLNVAGRLVIGQLAEIHADVYKDGAKKKLFHALIHLDEGKFLKPDFAYDKDNIVRAIEHNRQRNAEMLKQLNNVGDEIGNEIEEELKDFAKQLSNARVNIKQLQDYYQAELTKLDNELQADQTIKDIMATLDKHFGAIISAVVKTVKQVLKRLEELQKQYQDIVSKLKDAWEAVLPKLKSLYQQVLHVCVSIFNDAVNISVAYLKAAFEVINEHQAELKELATMASELAQDVAKIVFKAASQIKKDVDEFVALLMDQLEALPIYEIVKEKYQEILKFQVPQTIMDSIEEIYNAVKGSLPTEELRQLFEAIQQYVAKHNKHEKVDDAAELKKIYSLAIDALRSIINYLGSETDTDDLYDLLETKLPIDMDTWGKWPAITAVRVSVFDLLRNREFPTLADLYYTYRPSSKLEDIVPPFEKFGIVVEGGHFFTFDSKSFSMPGDCNYILAQDMLDGNFSVVANFNKGSLISVTVTEPKESITLKNNGDVLVNNKPAEFPAETKNLNAFLIPRYQISNVKSDYGVLVACSYKAPMVCVVEVSGYYHGRLRGLLGDGNHEQHDDYTLPSGKITESETEFANGYKLKSDCATVNAIDHKTQQRNPVCTEYFSGEKSTMKRCFNYVNPSSYRDACDNAAATNPQAPCLIAIAYSAVCHYKRVSKVSMPPACVTCKVGGNTISGGDSFSVKVPKDQADIILAIEQDAQNEKVFKDLVPALITDLKEELKHHGINDVHISLMGFGEHMEWPQYYTVGGNLNIEGDVKNMKFEKSDPIISLEEAKNGDVEKKLAYIGQRLDVEFGTFTLTDAYVEAIHYPFRPGAVKTVVGIVSKPCERSPLPLSLQQVRLLQGLKTYRDLGLTYHHIYFSGDIQVSGKTQKNIVAYDQDSAYILADHKKKPLSGNSELRNNMVLPAVDVCADFALTSGGAAFSSSNLLDAKPNQKRQFAQVTARRIVESLMEVEIEQDCVCQEAYVLSGISHCKTVNRREKEQFAKHTKGSVKG